jgi:hypothetical protein
VIARNGQELVNRDRAATSLDFANARRTNSVLAIRRLSLEGGPARKGQFRAQADELSSAAMRRLADR